MHLYRLGELTLYSLTDISLICVPINRVSSNLCIKLCISTSLDPDRNVCRRR